MSDQFLTGKVALVTGSSRGIGRAIALALAGRGADIAVHFVRKKNAAAETVAAVESLGRRAIAVKANLVDATPIETMLDEIESTFGRCDIFVGNAASGTPRGILDVNDKHWDWTMDVNARSILRIVQRLAPQMEAAGWGRVVNITSPGGMRVLPHYGAIGLSKAVVEALTRYLAVDLAPKGIIVNAVSPGLIETDAVAAFPVDLKEVFDYAATHSPTRRLTTPEEVGHLVAFLCSDAAHMIVGQTITIDGGYGLLIH
jgi:enoyl-[acyl-carrier protein] reductase III